MVKHVFPTFPFFPPKKEMYIGEKNHKKIVLV